MSYEIFVLIRIGPRPGVRCALQLFRTFEIEWLTDKDLVLNRPAKILKARWIIRAGARVPRPLSAHPAPSSSLYLFLYFSLSLSHVEVAQSVPVALVSNGNVADTTRARFNRRLISEHQPGQSLIHIKWPNYLAPRDASFTMCRPPNFAPCLIPCQFRQTRFTQISV